MPSASTTASSIPKSLTNLPVPKLFEEFFIVGVENKEVENLRSGQTMYLPPGRLFQYPGLPENANWYCAADSDCK